jgi:dihydroorotase-like cyclic amidohydrolase
MKIQINNAKSINGEIVNLFIDNNIVSKLEGNSSTSNNDNNIKHIDASNMLVLGGAKDYWFLSTNQFKNYILSNNLNSTGISRIYNISTDFDESMPNTQIDDSWLANRQYLSSNINDNKDIVLHQIVSTKNIPSLMNVLEYAKMHNKIVHINAQIFNQHSMMGDDSHISTRLGLSQGLACYETSSIAFMLELIKQVKCNISIYNISCAESLEIINQAKKYAKQHKFSITANIDIHQLLLSHHDIGYFNTYAKFYPPLRSLDNQKLLVHGILDNIIDGIYSGHKSVTIEDKQAPFASAVVGASSAEIFIALLFKLANLHNIELSTVLHKAGISTNVDDMISNQNNRSHGIALFNPNHEYVLNEHSFNTHNNANASPFLGYAIQGKVFYSI